MPDMSAISGVAASLNTAINIVKAMKDLRDWSVVQAKVIELQSTILDAQSSIFAANQERATLIERVRNLEEELAASKAWDAEKERYQLTDVGDGTFAYMLKPDKRGTEPPHYLCAHCYEQGKKAILQHMETRGMGDLLTCPSCKTKSLIADGYKSPSAVAAPKPKARGEACPKCGVFEYRVERSEPHPTFGNMGGVNRHMKCSACSFSEVVLTTPK